MSSQPVRLSRYEQFRQGIFSEPEDIQIFVTELDRYKERVDDDDDDDDFDHKRFIKIAEIEKKIAKAMADYIKSFGKKSPIKIEEDNHVSGHNKPFEQALTKITITKPKNIVEKYVDDSLKRLKDNHHSKIPGTLEDAGFTWHALTKNISNAAGGIAGPTKATITFELDMRNLLSPTTSGGGRRSFRKNYKKVKSAKRGSSAKRVSRSGTRKYRNRK
jgi:hypothetical protein